MKKFMIFLLMAFLYLGTSQASNEFTPSTSDVGNSLRHWVSPSVSSSAYAKFKPFSSYISDFEVAEYPDSIMRVYLVGPTHACPGQTIQLTAVVENSAGALDSLHFEFRRNGQYIGTGDTPDYRNRISVVVPDLGGLDSLIQEYDVLVTRGCQRAISPVLYLRVNSIHVLMDSVYVCNDTDKGMLCADVYSNGAETPYAYVWYNAADSSIVDTTFVPCKLLDTGYYFVEPHFTWSACVAQSNIAAVKKIVGPADNHITMDDITALVCNGNQVSAKLSGMVRDTFGTPSYTWSLNGITIPGANDSIIVFSPFAIAGDTTMYILKAEVTYSNYACKTYSVSDTVKVVTDPTISIYGDATVCEASLTNKELYARTNGYITGAVYKWKIDGTEVNYAGINDTLKLSQVTPAIEERDYPYEVTVSVTGGNGCSASSTTYLLYVYDQPVVYISKSADSVCAGTPVTLTANLADNNIPNLTYQWWYKKGSASVYTKDSTATGAQYIATVDSATSFIVVVKQTDSECQSSDTVQVSVYPNTLAPKPLVLNVSDTAVCYGDHITLTLNDTANTHQYGVEGTYQWFVNGVEFDDAEGKTLAFSPAITNKDSAIYTISVKATYTTTCEPVVVTKDTTVVLFKAPTVEISGDPIVCHDDTVRLTAHIHGSLDTNLYVWRVDGVDSIQNKPFVAQLTERDYPYNITLVAAPGTACEVVSEPYPVIIGNTATAALEASDTIVCKGSNVTLTAHLGDYNMPNLTYRWFRKVGTATNYDSIAIGTSRVLTIPVSDTTKYFVRITQVNSGCVAYSDTITVNVFDDAPAAKELVLVVNDSIICNGGQITLAVVDTANYNLYQVKGIYQWAVNGVTVANATDSIFNFSPMAFDNDSTIYNISSTVTYVTPCAVITASIDTIVNVFANPTVVISGDPILCQDSTVNLVATVHDTIVGKEVKYLWRVDGVDSVNQNTSVFSAVLPQRDYPYEISVVINQGAGCSVVSDVYEVLIGINPTVAIGISAPVVCKGDDVTLTAHLGDYNMPNLVYQWYQSVRGADTTAIAIGTSRELTVPVSDTTRYFVHVQQVNSKCEVWADTVINVFPDDPMVQPIELIASDSNICIGGQITYAVQDTTNRIQYFGSDSIPGAYRWFVNGFELTTAHEDHFTFSPATYDLDSTNYVVEVIASYQTECNLWIVSAADTITVHRNPSIVINGDPMICDTTLVSLVAIVNDSLVNTNVTYLWRVDGVDSTSMTTNVFQTNLPARDYPYEITVMLNQGTNCEVVSEPFYLYIEDQPEVVVTVDYDTVCVGQVVNLTAHLGNYNQPNLTYQWYVNDTVLVAEGTESTLAYTITNTDFTAFKVVVTQLNSACQGTGRDTVVTAKNPVFDTVLVTNLQDDIFDAYQYHHYYGEPAYDVCEGASIQVTAYMKDELGNRYIDTNITYRWKRNGVVIEGVNGYTFMEQLSILDHDQYKYVYTVEVAEPQYPNCYAVPVATASDTVKVRRNPHVVISGQRYVCYQGPGVNNILLQAFVDGGLDTGAIYRWYRDGMLEDNPWHLMYGAMFTGPFAPRYGFDYIFQVEVVNGSGCSSWSEPFPVTVMAPPVINITPYEDTVCNGGEVMLVSHLDDYNVIDHELKYQWYANEITDMGLIPGATEAYYNTHVDTTTAYIVTVKYLVDNTDVPSRECTANDTTVVTVYDRPVIDSIIMSLTEVCEGSQIQLTAVMDSVHQGVPSVPYIYEWYRNSELMYGNGETIYDAPMTVDGNEQQFTYSVKVYQYPDRMMCESPIYVSSQTLTVYPNPIVAVSGDQHICYTDTITLTANIDTISNPVSTNVHYYWFESGAPINNLNGDSAVLKYYGAAQDEPYRFTVQVERENADRGCRAYSYEYDVWVYNAPVANVTIVDEKVCEGAEVTVTAHLNQNAPEQTNLEYQWYAKTVNDTDFVLVPGATELTYTTIINDTTTFKFEVVHTLSGCFDTDSATIFTYPIPVVTSVSMSDTNVCEGSDVIITAHIDSTKGIQGLPYFYEWRRNGELLEGNTATIHDQPMTADGTTQTYVYSAIAYQTPDRLACTSDLTNSAELTVFGNPRVAIFGDQHVCYTDTINLVANVDTFTNPVGDLHFQWYESGNMITNLNGDSRILSYVAPAQDEPYRFTVQIERDNSETGCRSYSNEYDVWVYNAPVANVTIVDSAVCEGAEVTVTAHLNQNVPEQTNLVYQWYTKTANDTAFVLVPGATDLTYTTTIFETTEFQFGVVHTLSGCHDEDSKTITVYPIPVVDRVVMSDTNVCEGAQIAITAILDSTVIGVPGYPYYYEWRRNGELLAGNTQTIYDSPMTVDGNEQTYVYSVIAYQTPERLACYSSLVESATLNVYPNPRVSISGDQYVCETDSVFLYANVDTIGRPVGLLHYTWYESGRLRDNMAYGLADSRYFSEYFYAQDEPYRFTVEVQRDNIEGGCRAYSEEFLVWVYKQPVVNITASETEVCVGGEVTLVANLNNYEFNYANDAQYQWYTIDTVVNTIHIGIDSVTGDYIDSTLVTVEHNVIPGATTLFYTAVMTGTQSYGFTATHNLSGCSDYDEITITVNDIPVIVSVENLSGQDTLCPGGRVELHATVDGGVPGGEVYTWYRNGVQLEATGENVIDYPLAVDNNVTMYIYEVVVKQTAAGCESVIDSLSTDTIWVVPNPTIELSGDPIVCDTTNPNIVITANVVSYVDTTNYGYTYQWYENNAPIDGETGLVLSTNRPYRDYPYSFNFAVTSPYGCTVNSEPFLVYVNDNPIVGITVDDTMICVNGTVTLTADLYDQNADNMVYQWYKDSIAIEGAYDLTYTTTLAQTSTFKFYAYQRDSHCAAYSNEITVKVVDAPTVDSITVVSEDVTICEGHVVELHANVTGGDNDDEYVYTWYKDNEIVEGATGANFTDYPMSVDNDLTTHTYNVTVAQASSACFSLYDESDVVTVTVRPNPRYTIYGDADVCENPDTTVSNITLYGITNDQIIGTAADYIFTWYESGVVVDGQTSATLNINKPYRHEPYLFKLVVTDTIYGCTAETAEFAVTVAQTPVVVIAVDQDSICEGGFVTLTSTLLNPTEDGIIYQWQDSVNGGTWSDVTGAIAPVFVTPALTQTTTFRLHVTNTFNGCESYSNEVPVTVKPTPVIDITNVTADVVCNGGEVTLTATNADQYTGLGDIQYQWYENGQAIFGANQNVYTTSPLTVDGDMTTYTFGVQVTMTNSGCVSNVDTATVTVYADPTVTITYNNGLTLCEGGVTTLTANPHHAYFTNFSYQWFLHGMPIPGANNNTYVVENLAASANPYDYTVEITVENGTQNGCSAMAEPVFVTIVNDPTAYITVDENVNAICEGGTVTFTVHVNDGVADTYNPYTFAWYNNISGNGVVLGTEASYTTSADDAANLYVYTVDVQSLYGCNVQVSDTLRIVADPTVTIAVKTGEDTVVCDGGFTTLIATVEGGLGTATYQWYKNGFAIPGANGNELVTDALHVNETSAYTVSVAQTGIACTATSTQFNVNVVEAIEVALYTSSEVNCVGGAVTLTAVATNGVSGDLLTYQWYRNGNPINGANAAQYVTDDNLVAGLYEYQVEVSSNISGCHVAQSGTIAVTVEAEPTVTISSDVDGNAICEGGDMTLTANVIYATNATQHNNTYTYTWKWYEGTTLNSAQTSEPHYTLPTTLAAGSYNFFVEISSNDGLGCDASSQSNLFNVVVKPVPSVILTANAAESCQGGEVTFNAVVIPSNLSGIFYWTVNGNQVVTSNSTITVNDMVVGTNNISVVFAPNDAQVACNSAAASITHIVNAIPVVTLAATDASRMSMCVGGTITIAATATGTASSSDHYVWTLDGQIQYGNTGSTFTTQLNTPGIHTVSAMVERAMGCNSVFSTPIAIAVADQPTAQLTQTAGFNEMCAGGSITLMAKVSNYSAVTNGVTNNAVHGTYTYTWYRDNAEFTTTPNVTVDNAQISETLNIPASYTYSVTIAASGYNCQPATATLDHQIRVVPDPSWSVNQVNPTELCIGGIVTLNAEVTGGVENQQAGRIQWYKTFNGIESEVAGLGGQNTDVPEAAGVYTYAPKYIDYIGAGCNIADATPTQVTVNDLPTATFTSGHGSVICGHDYQSFATLEITLTGTAPFTFTIMNMTTGESQTIVTSLNVYSYYVNPSVTSIYRIVSVSDANGCIGAMDNVADAVVTVSDVQIDAEVVLASCDTPSIARIPLMINSSTANTAFVYMPDGSIQTPAIMFDSYTQEHYIDVNMTWFSAGDYRVTVEVDGCTGEVDIRVPASDITVGISATLVDQRWDDVVVVNNNPDNNGGFKFSRYQWYKNGEPISGATGQYYQEVGGLEGFYSVELDGVRVSDGTHVHFITCEKYFSGKSSIRVYPVPAHASQEVTIELNLTDEELNGAILDIYDVKGAHVQTLTGLTPVTKVSNFGAQGTYFGRIITGTNEIKTVKFIIVK
jgi:hypothetical protein